MSNFAIIRKTAAKVINNIGEQFPEVKEKAGYSAAMLAELDYEGGEQVLKDCLNMADEYDGEDLDEETIMYDGIFHDVICDLFYDLKLIQKHGLWEKYWAARK